MLDDEAPPLSFGPDDTGPLPHWTAPPTGEVPRILGDTGADEDWSSLQASGPGLARRPRRGAGHARRRARLRRLLRRRSASAPSTSDLPRATRSSTWRKTTSRRRSRPRSSNPIRRASPPSAPAKPLPPGVPGAARRSYTDDVAAVGQAGHRRSGHGPGHRRRCRAGGPVPHPGPPRAASTSWSWSCWPWPPRPSSSSTRSASRATSPRRWWASWPWPACRWRPTGGVRAPSRS